MFSPRSGENAEGRTLPAMTPTIAVMQPYLFPYLGYFHLMHAVGKFIVFDDVQFVRGGWVNRNRILLNGRSFRFTVPVHNASRNRRINEVKRGDDPRWRAKFLLTLEHAYRGAPHFEATRHLVQSILEEPEEHLATWITGSLRTLARSLSLPTEIALSSSCDPDTSLSRQDRILDICRKEGASTYVNLAGGTALYDKQAFARENVDLLFVRSHLMPYEQYAGSFVPALSIIDALMFNPVDLLVRDHFVYDLD
jgi:hypothetical protein